MASGSGRLRDSDSLDAAADNEYVLERLGHGGAYSNDRDVERAIEESPVLDGLVRLIRENVPRKGRKGQDCVPCDA